MKKVLIKGAKEFIGSHFTEALDEYSYYLRVFVYCIHSNHMDV